MPLNWGLLGGQPDIAGAFQSGLAHGQAQRRETQLRGALADYSGADPGKRDGALATIMANDPRLGMALRADAREQDERAALRQVFGGGMGAPFSPPSSGAIIDESGALGGYDPSQGPAVIDKPGGATVMAPTTLVDPATLPPRTDGLRLNPDALRRLAQIAPEKAFELQTQFFNADKVRAEQTARNGEMVARAAYQLRKLPADQRPAALQGYAPQLMALGLSEENIRATDLSDGGLDKYIALGRDLQDTLRDERAERLLSWNIEDDLADNARADRREAREETYRARSDARASEARSEGRVRFRERDKDRAAVAAGGRGVRTDLSDLDY